MFFREPKRRMLVLVTALAVGVILIGTSLLGPAFAASSTTSSADEGWSYADEAAYRLEAGWTVYRDTIIPITSFAGNGCEVPSAVEQAEQISAPDVWGPNFTFSITSGHGKATYCRSVELPTATDFYSLRLGTLRSVARVYAIYTDTSGQPRTLLLQENGVLESEGEQIVNNPAVPVISLPYGIQKMTLVMQLSNRIHKQGGMIEVPKIDYKWRLDAEENRATALPSALVICLLLVAVAALYIGRKSEHVIDHRLFAFLAAAAAFRAAFVSDLIWDYFPSFSLARKYDLEYLSLYFIAFAYYAFIVRLLRGGQRNLIDNMIFGFTGALIFFALFLAPFFPPGTITLTREPIQIIWGGIVLMMIYSVSHASIKAPEQRREAFVVTLAAVLYAAYEILSAFGVIAYSMEWSQFIVFMVIMMHAQAFVLKARRTEEERDALMARLEDTNRDLQNRALALDVALKRAEEASKAKSNFLATFSHELRTPLNAIIGFSEMMSREIFGSLGSPHYKGYVGDIHSSGTHLLSLVDDILDLARIEAGSDDLADQQVDICDLIMDVLSLLQVQAKPKRITLKLERSLKVPLILADERKMKQIMINLVTNAIKFNKEKGKVTVNVHADETGLYIDVTDTGIGIAEKEIPVVMSRFGRADSGKKQDNSGVGIGLPLSDVLVRQHGGTVKVTSAVGEGTCIGIWLPPSRFVTEQEVA